MLGVRMWPTTQHRYLGARVPTSLSLNLRPPKHLLMMLMYVCEGGWGSGGHLGAWASHCEAR